jgi:chromate transporter
VLVLARLGLWLGVVGFGGGFAVAQQIKRILVERERWLDEAEFLESFAAATALPGAQGVNLLAIAGVRIAGITAGVAAATAFLLPSIGLMLAFGALYDRLRNIASLATCLDGMSVATIGVIAGVAADIGRSALKRPYDWLLAAFAGLGLATHALTLLETIALAALCGTIFLRPRNAANGMMAVPVLALAASPVALLLFVFARIGLATFGGGFAMIPAILHEVVVLRHWLTPAAFNDAIVLGQVTPGPVAIAATFIGYRIGGLSGAAAATIGMFAPPLVLSLATGRSLGAFRSNDFVQGALRGIAPAMVGIMGAAAIALWRTSVHGVIAALIALVAGVVLVSTRRVLPLLVLALGGAAMLALGHLR